MVVNGRVLFANGYVQVGSEFVQKYLGEGPRMVRDVFRLARENSPSVIFIDEIDAIATKRFDAQTGADREVQRILLELLNQMDGFDQSTNVKVCDLIFTGGCLFLRKIPDRWIFIGCVEGGGCRDFLFARVGQVMYRYLLRFMTVRWTTRYTSKNQLLGLLDS